ncbi:hypothetical protein SEA_ZETA1847_72 [Microbacterium phage Zeta1847]|uniref:Uncharacterized protein n=1 Tax=Microbacterium phage Zeta1847 TaxID=2201444 RepID=A0A2Z4Q9F5_9CAUD|nr:hypothetical protein HOT46_gp72 [Microbacterium phage Zeta1847]AWY06706.1 hypothetical protein SEA_ZETA1847_72 [Microbacterium phage Zeta1847]
MTDNASLPAPGELASEPLDKLLRDWRDLSIGTGAAAFLVDEVGGEEEAAERIEAAEVAFLAATADLVDAFRTHPALGYGDAVERLTDLLAELPEPHLDIDDVAAAAAATIR